MESIQNYRGGSEDFFARAKAHALKPTIVNNDSNFVVITYWWGRGNLNKNTQRPCPEDLEQGEKPDEPPIKFEAMIANWEKACSKHKCNFLAEEYPEFAVKGGYQHAINFKPYFIDLALAACYPRSVLYIDGDMKIKKYPSICDMKGIDYMARGWNVDPRPRHWKASCFDPYVLETSGGTMFFGNTFYGRQLLKAWQRETLKNPGKADDRILSMAITMKALLTTLSTVQLPIEYLWLDMDYDGVLKKVPRFSKKNQIAISHPECLTGEDRAADEGAASNRYPRAYDRYVSNLIECRKNEIIYEYIHFDDKTHIGPFRPYFDWLSEKNVVKVVPYSKGYGDRNGIAGENSNLLRSLTPLIHDQVVIVSENDINTISLHKVSSKREVPTVILSYLLAGQHVVYVPRGTRSVRVVLGKANENSLDFVTKNLSESHSRSKIDYILKLDDEYPIYFGPNNKVLRHLLLMSSSISDLEKTFNESYIFLTRIHCGWI
jgi:hypothetical protein